MTPNRDNSTRTKARKRALDILYESELRGRPATDTLAERIGLGEPPVRPFTIELVNGVLAHLAELDDAIAGVLASNWTLERMAHVDRNLARIALYEVAYTDTPPKVAINEAVDLAAELSTPSSPSFLSGVLSAAAERLAVATPGDNQDT